MTLGWNRVVGLLFWRAAVASPLDLLQYIPGTGLSLLSLIALLLIPPLLLDALSQQKLRVPFEVLMPVVAVLALVGVHTGLHGPPDTFGEIVSGMILLVAVVHFAPPRETIRRYVFAYVLSGFAVTLITLTAQLIDAVPTAFSERSEITFTFAYTVPSAIHTLFLVTVAALYVASERRFKPTERAAASGALVFLFCGLAATTIFWIVETMAPPVAAYPSLGPLEIAAVLTALWLLSRVMAKVVVDARSAPDRLHALWLGAGAVTIAVCACAPVPPAANYGYLLGLACATMLPSRFISRPYRLAPAFLVLPTMLAVTNILVASPENTRDQRQYDAASARDFAAGEFRRLLERLDTIAKHAPEERRTHLWRARTALALGSPNWASFEYARAVAPVRGATVLAPPTDAERKDFVVQMRDAVASMTESDSVCAFERTLIAEGDRDAALYSLRLETAVALTHIENTDIRPIAAAVSVGIGDERLGDALELWTADELMTLLSYWGATLEDLNTGARQLILVAQRTLSGLHVFVSLGGKAETMHRDLPTPTARDAASLLGVDGMQWTETASDTFALVVRHGQGTSAVGELRFRNDGSPRFDLVDSASPIPFTPAIRLRLGS